MYRDPLDDPRASTGAPGGDETQPLVAPNEKGKYKARVENLKSALRKWVTINEQRSMALQNSADDSERIRETSKVQKRLMADMGNNLKKIDNQAKQAEELVKQQSAQLDQVESLGSGTAAGVTVVLILIAVGLFVAFKLHVFDGVIGGASVVAPVIGGGRRLLEAASQTQPSLLSSMQLL